MEEARMSYEDILNTIRQRRSVRQFKAQPVSHEDILKVLEAARWAPSGRNSQPWEFVVVTDPAQIEQLKQLFTEQRDQLVQNCPSFRQVPSHRGFMDNASALIFVCGDPRFKAAYPQSDLTPELTRIYREGAEHIYTESVGAAINNLLLAATALGIGTVWYTGSDEEIIEPRIKSLLNIPEIMDVFCCIPLGYPAAPPAIQRVPRPLASMVHYGRFEPKQWRTEQDIRRYVQDAKVRDAFARTGKMPE
jgi:FMN reductase (NADPH)